jgi:hypothetical protein
MTLLDDRSSTFTSDELARLAAYRDAVTAGFYTDWDGSTDSTDTETLAWLERSGAAAADFPFTPAEVERLERCRAAVAGGYYSEGLPAPAAE